MPVVTASPALVSAMFEGERLRAADAFERAQARKGGDAFELNADKVLTMTAASIDETLSTQNVVADLARQRSQAARRVRGARRALRPRRHDGRPATDRIFNGADDDGSGTTALLAIAEALARGR